LAALPATLLFATCTSVAQAFSERTAIGFSAVVLALPQLRIQAGIEKRDLLDSEGGT
jgi:hypothetical protein